MLRLQRELVGIATARTVISRGCCLRKKLGYIMTIGVAPTKRRSGLGTALLEVRLHELFIPVASLADCC